MKGNTLRKKGFTLVELMVSVGLFAVIMTLVSGAYFMMMNINHQAQSIATGINSLSFALETMIRDIRTGTSYACESGGDCATGSSFTFQDETNTTITYSTWDGVLQRGIEGAPPSKLTDPSVNVSDLTFRVEGSGRLPDRQQAYVTIWLKGSVSTGANSAPRDFSIETSVAMRGTDI